jgi:hypothetical protein
MAETIRTKVLEIWTKRAAGKEWSTLRIPEGIRMVFSRVMHMQRTVNQFTGQVPASVEAA